MRKGPDEMMKILSKLKEDLMPIIKECEKENGISIRKLTIDMVDKPDFVGLEDEDTGTHFYV